MVRMVSASVLDLPFKLHLEDVLLLFLASFALKILSFPNYFLFTLAFFLHIYVELIQNIHLIHWHGQLIQHYISY